MISKTMVDTGFPSRTVRIMEAAIDCIETGQAHKANGILCHAVLRIKQEIEAAERREKRKLFVKTKKWKERLNDETKKYRSQQY